MPAKAKPVDWVTVELEYRAGMLTLRAIGDRHGVSNVAIIKRAKQYGWTRDLRQKIEQERENKLNEAMVVARSREEKLIQFPIERQTVEVNAQMQADLIISHRRDISSLRGTVARMVDELGDMGESRFRDFINKLEDATGDERIKALTGALNSALALPGRSTIARNLVTCLSTLIDKEREAFGINHDGDRPKSLGEILDALQ